MNEKLEKLSRQKTAAEKKLIAAQHREKQLEHERKRLTRSERTHRLCTRAGMLEKFLREPTLLTDDDVMELLTFLFHDEAAQRKLDRLKKTRALEPISEAAIPFDFPQPWKVCYIDDIAFVTKLAGFEYTKYIADNLVADGIPLFKGKNVQNGKLVLSFESYIPKSISDELPRSQIAKKCLLTPYVGTIGNIAIFDGSFKAHLGSNVGKIELLNSDIQTFVLEEYVLWYLKSTYGYAELTKHKKATAQESISIDAIRNVIIAIPPLEEQYRIVAKIEELLPLCDRLRK